MSENGRVQLLLEGADFGGHVAGNGDAHLRSSLFLRWRRNEPTRSYCIQTRARRVQKALQRPFAGAKGDNHCAIIFRRLSKCRMAAKLMRRKPEHPLSLNPERRAGMPQYFDWRTASQPADVVRPVATALQQGGLAI